MEFDIADPPSPQLWIVPKKNLNEGFPYLTNSVKLPIPQ